MNPRKIAQTFHRLPLLEQEAQGRQFLQFSCTRTRLKVLLIAAFVATKNSCCVIKR